MRAGMKPVSLSRFRAGLITDYVASGWRFVADRGITRGNVSMKRTPALLPGSA
jgi:hypothetical protein